MTEILNSLLNQEYIVLFTVGFTALYSVLSILNTFFNSFANSLEEIANLTSNSYDNKIVAFSKKCASYLSKILLFIRKAGNTIGLDTSKVLTKNK